VLPGKGNNPRNFVAAEDVAKVIVGAIRIPALRGETIDVGGPENLTNREVVQIFERLSGRKAKITYLPLGVLRAMSGVAGRAHPGVGRIMRMMIINETRDQRFDPTMLRTKIPITLTSLESWARNRIRR
jgi:nucleoside-diphosphate-sugar epimerase